MALTHWGPQGRSYAVASAPMPLAETGIEPSVGSEGNCYDNAAIESFFGTLKAEFFYLSKFDNVAQLDAGVHVYIEYYNYERIKLGLQGLSPVAYRLKSTA